MLPNWALIGCSVFTIQSHPFKKYFLSNKMKKQMCLQNYVVVMQKETHEPVRNYIRMNTMARNQSLDLAPVTDNAGKSSTKKGPCLKCVSWLSNEVKTGHVSHDQTADHTMMHTTSSPSNIKRLSISLLVRNNCEITCGSHNEIRSHCLVQWMTIAMFSYLTIRLFVVAMKPILINATTSKSSKRKNVHPSL